jgi:UDP-N-acetylmuramoylalanine--D-glutamate ligase
VGAFVTPEQVAGLSRTSDWSGVRAGVAGLGVAGFACADSLVHLGAEVVAFDSADGSGALGERATLLEVLGATVRLGDGDTLPGALDVLVVSPGLPPHHPVIAAALAAGVTVWGELELAWRLRDPQAAAPWLVVTGTNGKTTTTLMLESMLLAAGRRAVAAGNIGRSLVEVVMEPAGYDVIAVEVGAPQLPFVHTVSPQAAVCLNVAPDHVDHFGGFGAYVAAKARIYERTQVAAVYNAAEPLTEQFVRDADVVEGCRAIGFGLGVPGLSMLGVVDDLMVDRAFVPDRAANAQELASVHDVRPYAPHNVSNALAAAALARAHGVPAAAVRDGLRAFEPAGHRIADAGTVAGVSYVDDSKATNAHAAETSLLGYEPVVWIAGGLAKGQSFDELVQRVSGRLRGVVLLGADRAVFRDALARHAPDVPVVEVERTDTGAMDDVVRAAHALARPGDTVLLAPGCASWDMFRDYAQRGDRFASAVSALAQETP